MRIRLLTTLIVCFLMTSLSSYSDHHGKLSDEEILEEMTLEHSRTASRGEWEAHFAMYAVGCTAFYEAGMKRTNMRTAENIENRIRNRKTWNENGGRRGIFARHPEAVVYGNTAVVTCYHHGWYENTDGERTYVLGRASLIWNKIDGDWKIVHEHYSDLKKDFPN